MDIVFARESDENGREGGGFGSIGARIGRKRARKGVFGSIGARIGRKRARKGRGEMRG